MFLCQGLGQGIGTGLTFLPSVGIVAHYFQRKRGLAMGIVVMGSGLGGAIHPIMLNQLFFGCVGFHNGVRASAGLNAGLLLIGNLLVRTRLRPRHASTSVPLTSFAKDKRYVFTLIGYFVLTSQLCNSL
jgi:MFS family permease